MNKQEAENLSDEDLDEEVYRHKGHEASIINSAGRDAQIDYVCADRGFRCSVCGGSNLEIATWVNPNTEEVKDHFGSWSETDTKFCHDCDDNVQITEEGRS